MIRNSIKNRTKYDEILSLAIDTKWDEIINNLIACYCPLEKYKIQRIMEIRKEIEDDRQGKTS
jgi:hypothetical protein